MTQFYSPSKNGFYDSAINASIPSDAVEISADEHSALFSAQASGHVIVAGADGAPVAQAPVAPAPTAASALAALGRMRLSIETGGVLFQPAGAATPSLFASDRGSQAMIHAAAARGSSGPWKCADGSWVTLTAADLVALDAKIGLFVQACFTHEASLAPEVSAAPATPIDAGWPSNA